MINQWLGLANQIHSHLQGKISLQIELLGPDRETEQKYKKIRLRTNRPFFKEAAMLNNCVFHHKNHVKAMHNYCIMHILIIMRGFIIVFMLNYIIIQHGSLFKKRSIHACLEKK